MKSRFSVASIALMSPTSVAATGPYRHRLQHRHRHLLGVRGQRKDVEAGIETLRFRHVAGELHLCAEPRSRPAPRARRVPGRRRRSPGGRAFGRLSAGTRGSGGPGSFRRGRAAAWPGRCRVAGPRAQVWRIGQDRCRSGCSGAAPGGAARFPGRRCATADAPGSSTTVARRRTRRRVSTRRGSCRSCSSGPKPSSVWMWRTSGNAFAIAHSISAPVASDQRVRPQFAQHLAESGGRCRAYRPCGCRLRERDVRPGDSRSRHSRLPSMATMAWRQAWG